MMAHNNKFFSFYPSNRSVKTCLVTNVLIFLLIGDRDKATKFKEKALKMKDVVNLVEFKESYPKLACESENTKMW